MLTEWTTVTSVNFFGESGLPEYFKDFLWQNTSITCQVLKLQEEEIKNLLRRPWLRLVACEVEL